MTFDIRRTDLDKLNSLTKYPSILTYHTLGDKGALREAVQVPFAGRVLGTEKVDGTNARLIFCPDGSAVVGSREDLLWERRDLIGNPLKVSAQFAAFVWYSEVRRGTATEEEALRFAEANWLSFLGRAHEGRGKLLMRLARPRRAETGRVRRLLFGRGQLGPEHEVAEAG